MATKDTGKNRLSKGIDLQNSLPQLRNRIYFLFCSLMMIEKIAAISRTMEDL